HDITQHAELNRLREQLLYSVAHELRGPLGVLDNALDILGAKYGALSAQEFDQLVRSARRTAARLRGLMEDLLGAGNIQSGRFQVRPQPMRLSDLFDEAIELVEELTEAHGQRIERQASGELLTVLADPRYARQVVSNLLSNASKYSPDGEVIRLRARRERGQVRV